MVQISLQRPPADGEWNLTDGADREGSQFADQ
jgi:hypothetical protein